MTDEDNKLKEGKWKIASFIVCVVVFIDIVLLLLGMAWEINILGFILRPNIAFSVGGIGIITFFGVIVISNYLSESKFLEKGEMRKAIAASFTIVYIALLSLLTFKGVSLTDSGLSQTMIDHFTTLVGVIVAFYFGSRSFDEYSKKKTERENAKVKQLENQIILQKLKKSNGKKNEKKD